jgi:hypothetical protein
LFLDSLCRRIEKKPSGIGRESSCVFMRVVCARSVTIAIFANDRFSSVDSPHWAADDGYEAGADRYSKSSGRTRRSSSPSVDSTMFGPHRQTRTGYRSCKTAQHLAANTAGDAGFAEQTITIAVKVRRLGKA